MSLNTCPGVVWRPPILVVRYQKHEYRCSAFTCSGEAFRVLAVTTSAVGLRAGSHRAMVLFRRSTPS